MRESAGLYPIRLAASAGISAVGSHHESSKVLTLLYGTNLKTIRYRHGTFRIGHTAAIRPNA